MTALLCKNVLIRAGVKEKVCVHIKTQMGVRLNKNAFSTY